MGEFFNNVFVLDALLSVHFFLWCHNPVLSLYFFPQLHRCLSSSIFFSVEKTAISVESVESLCLGVSKCLLKSFLSFVLKQHVSQEYLFSFSSVFLSPKIAYFFTSPIHWD